MGTAVDLNMANSEGMLKDFDYLWCVYVDIDGNGRGKIFPKKSAIKNLQYGFGVATGSVGRRVGGVKGMTEDEVRSVTGKGRKNVAFQADLDTFCEIPWGAEPGYRVAEVLGDCYKTEEVGAPAGFSPRFSATEQLRRLDSMGYILLGAGEVTCQIRPKRDQSKGSADVCVVDVVKKQRFMIEVEQNLERAGVHVNGIDIDRENDLLCFTLSTSSGIKVADDMHRMKSALQAIGFRSGYDVIFPSRPGPVSMSSGLSIRLCLLQKGSRANVFYDESSPHRLSLDASYWISGLMRHAPAMKAFLSPNKDCYPASGTSSNTMASFASWGIGSLFATVCIHNRHAQDTFVEVSNASSSSNPYLVLASCLAAGIDGLTSKAACPTPDTKGPRLPDTLKDALGALHQDGDLRQALGGPLIRRFVESRAELDITDANDFSQILADQHRLDLLLPE